MALLPSMVAWVMLVCNGICVGNNIFILPVEGKKSLEVKLIVQADSDETIGLETVVSMLSKELEAN